jgi:hypothetical protein
LVLLKKQSIHNFEKKHSQSQKDNKGVNYVMPTSFPVTGSLLYYHEYWFQIICDPNGIGMRGIGL